MNRFAMHHPEDWEQREEAMVDGIYAEADRVRKERTEPPIEVRYCQSCKIVRPDYEGHNAHLPSCPNCGSYYSPVLWSEIQGKPSYGGSD
jgi:hypothetical protein